MVAVAVLGLIAAGLLGVLGWGLFVYFRPYRTCRWCKNRKRGRRCWRCKGTRMTRRLGAWHAHKVRDSLARAWQERGYEDRS